MQGQELLATISKANVDKEKEKVATKLDTRWKMKEIKAEGEKKEAG